MITHPFENEQETTRIDELTVENRLDRVQLYGSVELTRDQVGYARARQLKELLDRVVAALEGQDLPEAVTVEAPGTVPNPFM